MEDEELGKLGEDTGEGPVGVDDLGDGKPFNSLIVPEDGDVLVVIFEEVMFLASTIVFKS